MAGIKRVEEEVAKLKRHDNVVIKKKRIACHFEKNMPSETPVLPKTPTVQEPLTSAQHLITATLSTSVALTKRSD